MKTWTLFFSMLPFGLIGIYSFLVEPQWLQTSHHQIRGRVKQSIKIAHLSDLHFGNFFRLSSRVLAEIEKEDPDIILVTGDSYENFRETEKLESFFKSLRAPLGVYAVKGNWENWVPSSDDHAFWRSLGVKLLVNERIMAREDLAILGYDDSASGEPHRNLATTHPDRFRICLFHSPVFFETMSQSCSLSHT